MECPWYTPSFRVHSDSWRLLRAAAWVTTMDYNKNVLSVGGDISSLDEITREGCRVIKTIQREASGGTHRREPRVNASA